MAWIESHTDLESHPKLLLLKARMRWSKNEAVGFLHRFWWTVLKYAPNGVISALPLEVMSETLDIEVQNLDRILDVMIEIGLVDDVNGTRFIHDWPDYAGRYLKENLFKRKPDRWKEVEQLYGLSGTCQGHAKVPDHTNQTNQTDPANRLAVAAGIELNVGEKQRGELRDIIAIDGYENALKALRAATAKGIGPPACINYARKVLSGEKAKRDLNGNGTHDEKPRSRKHFS